MRERGCLFTDMERLHVGEKEADAAVLFALSVELLGVCPTHAHAVNLEKRARLTTHPLKHSVGLILSGTYFVKMAQRSPTMCLIPSGGSGVSAGHR